MPSVHRKQGSPFWYAAFYLPDGKRTLRSTGTKNKKKAMSICLKLAEASRQSKEGRFTDSRARQAIADIFQLGNGDSLPTSNSEEFLTNWLKNKKLEISDNSFREYSRIVREFLEHLGSKSKKPMDMITVQDASSYRSKLSERVRGATVNKALRTLRSAFSQAAKEGLVQDNPFSKVSSVKEEAHNRRAFTLDEVKRILNACSGEWKGLVLLGFYSGQRLGDLVRLSWSNVDLEHAEIRLVTRKTRRAMTIPVPEALLQYLMTLPSSDKPETPLFPEASKQSIPALSHQFRNMLADLGLTERVTHKADGKGRSARRQLNSLTFHCLRHTTTSILKNEGVSNAVAMELIGHESEAVNRSYTHMEMKSLRAAVNRLPDVISR